MNSAVQSVGPFGERLLVELDGIRVDQDRRKNEKNFRGRLSCTKGISFLEKNVGKQDSIALLEPAGQGC